MRLVVKKDNKITEEEMNELQRQFTDLYYENTDITPEFYVEPKDYTTYPTYIDSDNDIRPTANYLKGIASEVFDRYGEWGTDHIIVLIHEDNWQSDTDFTKGIWGTSYSNLWHTYHVQYVRFDRDNKANSLGTLYHEVMHSHDSLIKTTLGVDVDKMFGFDWDHNIVHGNGAKYSYIRYKENTDALAYIGPYLKRSYEKRRAFHMKDMGLMRTIISLLEEIKVIYMSKWNQKNGVPK